MKKVVAILLFATMLLGLVPAAHALQYSLQATVDETKVQWGPQTTQIGLLGASGSGKLQVKGDGFLISQYPNSGSYASAHTITISGKYGDLEKWFNFSNEAVPGAYIRFPINIDTSLGGVNSIVANQIVPGTTVYINGVPYPTAIDPVVGTSVYVTYAFKALAGGNSETVKLEYKPNGVDTFTFNLTINFIDTDPAAAKTRRTFVATDTGDNAGYFNSYSRDESFDFEATLKTAASTMIRKNLKFKPEGDIGIEIEVPVITMTSKIQVLDANGVPYPGRTIVRVLNPGTYEDMHFNFGSPTNMQPTKSQFESIFKFVAADPRNQDIFPTSLTATPSDVWIYELDTNGCFTIEANIVDNTLAVIQDQYRAISSAGAPGAPSTTGATNKLFFPLKTWDDAHLTNGKTIFTKGLQDMVNYKLLKDVQFQFETATGVTWTGAKFSVRSSSVDRITSPVISFAQGSSVDTVLGNTVQLTAVTNHANATDGIITWTSSNPAVATVNASGLVTPVSLGTTFVKARLNAEGIEAIITVNVKEATVTPVTPATTEYKVTCRNLNVRATPGATRSDAKVGMVHRGDIVNVYELVNDGKWAKISYANGIAYVSTQYISRF